MFAKTLKILIKDFYTMFNIKYNNIIQQSKGLFTFFAFCLFKWMRKKQQGWTKMLNPSLRDEKTQNYPGYSSTECHAVWDTRFLKRRKEIKTVFTYFQIALAMVFIEQHQLQDDTETEERFGLLPLLFTAV